MLRSCIYLRSTVRIRASNVSGGFFFLMRSHCILYNKIKNTCCGVIIVSFFLSVKYSGEKSSAFKVYIKMFILFLIQ